MEISGFVRYDVLTVDQRRTMLTQDRANYVIWQHPTNADTTDAAEITIPEQYRESAESAEEAATDDEENREGLGGITTLLELVRMDQNAALSGDRYTEASQIQQASYHVLVGSCVWKWTWGNVGASDKRDSWRISKTSQVASKSRIRWTCRTISPICWRHGEFDVKSFNNTSLKWVCRQKNFGHNCWGGFSNEAELAAVLAVQRRSLKDCGSCSLHGLCKDDTHKSRRIDVMSVHFTFSWTPCWMNIREALLAEENKRVAPWIFALVNLTRSKLSLKQKLCLQWLRLPFGKITLQILAACRSLTMKLKKSLSKGFSKNSVVDLLSGYFAEFETAVHSLTWIARMPSKSNVADSPSRNDTSSSFFNNAIDVSEPAKGIMVALLEKLERDGVRGFETSHPGKDRSRADASCERVCSIMCMSLVTTFCQCKCMAPTCNVPLKGGWEGSPFIDMILPNTTWRCTSRPV